MMNIPHERECTGIGVLDSDHIYTWRPGQREISRYVVPVGMDAEHLFEIAMDHKLNSLWLCPGSGRSLYFNEHPLDFVNGSMHERYKITVKRREADGVPQNAKISPLKGQYGYKPLVYILLPDHDPTWLEDQDNAGQSWALSDVEDARTFLATLIQIYAKTGAYLSTSPAATGVQSMKLLTKEADWKREEGEQDLPRAMPTQIYWHRRLFAKEEGFYLHRYDRNSMFLAACTGAELGIGMGNYLDDVAAPMAWRQSTPVGLWRVNISNGPRGLLMPHKTEWEGERWLTTSGVRAMHNLDYQVDILAAWVWKNDRENRITKSRRVLQPWAKQLWDSRLDLREKYGKDNPAYKLIKMIANRGLGWLDLRRLGKEEKPKWYNKPHWYAEVQGLGEYRMTITMQELKRTHGVYPVLIYADTFGLLSKEQDPRKAFPDLVRRELALGGFRPEMTLPVDAEVTAAFDQAGTFQVLQSLKTIEAGYGTDV